MDVISYIFTIYTVFEIIIKHDAHQILFLEFNAIAGECLFKICIFKTHTFISSSLKI